MVGPARADGGEGGAPASMIAVSAAGGSGTMTSGLFPFAEQSARVPGDVRLEEIYQVRGLLGVSGRRGRVLCRGVRGDGPAPADVEQRGFRGARRGVSRGRGRVRDARGEERRVTGGAPDLLCDPDAAGDPDRVCQSGAGWHRPAGCCRWSARRCSCFRPCWSGCSRRCCTP